MKFLGVLLVIFAVSCGRADSEDCTEERAQACLDNLLTAITGGDSTKEKVCRELRSSVDCLNEAVDDCLGDESDSEVEQGLLQLEKVLRDNCNAYDDKSDSDEEIQKCYEQNDDYISDCTNEVVTQVLSRLAEEDDIDENMLKCTVYGMMSRCSVDRVREKCGEKVASMVEEEMSVIPEEMGVACNAV